MSEVKKILGFLIMDNRIIIIIILKQEITLSCNDVTCKLYNYLLFILTPPKIVESRRVRPFLLIYNKTSF